MKSRCSLAGLPMPATFLSSKKGKLDLPQEKISFLTVEYANYWC